MMNKDLRAEWILWLLAFAFAGFGYRWDRLWVDVSYKPGPRDESGVRILTWNVGGSSGPSGSPFDDRHLDHVVLVLSSLDPDLAFLQEVIDDSQVDELLERLGENWNGIITQDQGRRVAALSPRGRLSGRTIHVGGKRRVLMAEYESIRGERLTVFGMHADAYSAEERNGEIGRAVDRLIGDERRGAKILIGDLNLDIDLDKRRDLFSANEQLDVDVYNYVANRLLDAGLGGGNTSEPDRRLDYIFVDPKAFEVKGAGPVKGKRMGDMDHDPVVADLRIKSNRDR